MDLRATIEYAEYHKGYDFYEETVLSVGPCVNAQSDLIPNAICVLIAGPEGAAEEYMVDGSEMPKACVLRSVVFIRK